MHGWPSKLNAVVCRLGRKRDKAENTLKKIANMSQRFQHHHHQHNHESVVQGDQSSSERRRCRWTFQESRKSKYCQLLMNNQKKRLMVIWNKNLQMWMQRIYQQRLMDLMENYQRVFFQGVCKKKKFLQLQFTVKTVKFPSLSLCLYVCVQFGQNGNYRRSICSFNRSNSNQQAP